MADRIDAVQAQLAALDADALLLTSLPNIRWACGFTGSNGSLIVAPDEAHFVTDGRYTEQAHEEVAGAHVHVARRGLSAYIQNQELLAPFDRVAFQSDDLTVAQFETLTDDHSAVDWVPQHQVLTHAVAAKDESEVERIRAAQAITEAVFDDILPFIEPGVTERELAAEITYRHLKRGAESMSFDPIVAAGENGARPHARPTDRPFQEGDMIVIDMGGFQDGYASDMTRTVALGDPGDEARRGYNLVREAQEQALDAARAGLTGKALDKVARDVIENGGLGDFFAHGLGHGIGLQVHEWPRVSHTTDDELPAGACVTIEPGVYVPEEGYGVRIEDIVVLRSNGAENLTGTSKDLRIL